jgi:two-component system LytT family sensor kinase
MPMMSHHAARARFSDWPLALKSIIGFWLFYALTVVARAFLGHDPATVLQNKSVTIAAGVVLTFGVYAAIRIFADEVSLRRRALVAGAASFLAAAALAGFLIAADKYQDKPQDEFHYISKEGYRVTESGNQMWIDRKQGGTLLVTWPRVSDLDPYEQFRYAADSMVVWLFFFAAWSAYYTAMQTQAQALGAQRRAAIAESAAQSAQVRALRYQVNPHFLFNTLNSLSSLIIAGRAEEAESMVLKLSTFFRSSLTLDATADISLAEEIALQRLYLDIEKVRFPRRLKAEFDVPAELENARLPALILQPIVENAIKHAVSQTRDKVELRIIAREAGPGRFTIEISNSGGRPAQSKNGETAGTGVGIANVCQRLSARFGSLAKCSYGPRGDGGYSVLLTLPLDRSDG